MYYSFTYSNYSHLVQDAQKGTIYSYFDVLITTSIPLFFLEDTRKIINLISKNEIKLANLLGLISE